MKKETRQRLSELILEELSERIRHDESLREKLEMFTELPVEKVADTLIKHIDLLLTDDLRDTLSSMVPPEPEPGPQEVPPVAEVPVIVAEVQESVAREPELVEESESVPHPEPKRPQQDESIMKHFSVKEPFPYEPFNLKLQSDDWYYLFGLSYAPDSTGKGVPAKMLKLPGVGKSSNIFLLDSGDIRLYLSKLSIKEYSLDTASRPVLSPQVESRFRYEHENTLNLLRNEEILVVFPHWTIYQGLDDLLAKVEERYVDLLKNLVEIQDTAEWELELFSFDHHILQVPSITAGAKSRSAPRREVKPPAGGKKNDVMVDKVIFREKSIAQDIHNQILLAASKAKVDFMIRLDTAFMDDWKVILSARYAVSKDKRKSFWQTIKAVTEQYQEYELMYKIRAKADRVTLE